MYNEPPTAVRPRKSLGNWTSVSLGNDPNMPYITDMENRQLMYNTVLTQLDDNMGTPDNRIGNLMNRLQMQS